VAAEDLRRLDVYCVCEANALGLVCLLPDGTFNAHRSFSVDEQFRILATITSDMEDVELPHAAKKSKSCSPPRIDPAPNASESAMPQTASSPRMDSTSDIQHQACEQVAAVPPASAQNAGGEEDANRVCNEQKQEGGDNAGGNVVPGSRAQTGSGSRMKHEDAMEFLERVREVFADRPFIYNSFLAVMKEFKDQTISTDGVINRVKLLFKGHPDLLQGFNLFLPPAYRIKVEAESPPNNAVAKIEDQKAQQFAAAYKYVTKVKKRFIAAPHTYKEFLTVLHKYAPSSSYVDIL
jgi:histone deacetylase complex regulatory component SIN3